MSLKLKLCREVCVKCRNDAYRGTPGEEYGMWDKNELVQAWWPKGDTIYREEYKGVPGAEKYCHVTCPEPILNKWYYDSLISIYNKIIDADILDKQELSLLKRGLNYLECKRALKKWKKEHKGEQIKWNDPIFTNHLDSDRFRVSLDVVGFYNKTYSFNNPPIWCPYKKEHKKRLQ